MIGCSEGGKEADWLFCPIAAEPAGKQANSNNYTDRSERTGSLYAHTFQQGIRPAKAFQSTHIYIHICSYITCYCAYTHKITKHSTYYIQRLINTDVQNDTWMYVILKHIIPSTSSQLHLDASCYVRTHA